MRFIRSLTTFIIITRLLLRAVLFLMFVYGLTPYTSGYYKSSATAEMADRGLARKKNF